MGPKREQKHFTSSLQELLITFWVFLRILSCSHTFLHAEFGTFSPPLRKIRCATLSLLSTSSVLQNFPSVTRAIVPPCPACWEPATVLWLLNPPWCLHVLGRNGGCGTWDGILGPSHFWSQRIWIPFCLADPGHVAFGNTLHSPDKWGRATNHFKILRCLKQNSIHYAQPPKSLVSSGHFFQLWGLRDYCESFPWGIKICIASETVQVRRWDSTCTQDGQELGVRPFLLLSRAELKGKCAIVLKIQLIPQAFHFVSPGGVT